MRRASSGCSIIQRTDAARAFGSRGLTSRPVAPGSTRSGTPFTAVATAGRPDREDLVACRLLQPLEEEVRGTPPDAHEVVEAEPMEGVDDDGRAGYPRCQAPHDAGFRRVCVNDLESLATHQADQP